MQEEKKQAVQELEGLINIDQQDTEYFKSAKKALERVIEKKYDN